jgi:hypothetical protein
MSRPLGPHEQWLALRGAVLDIPIMFSLTLKRPDAREGAIRVAQAVRKLHADAVAQFGELEAEDLVGSTLRYVQDRLVDLFGAEAWDESGDSNPPALSARLTNF